MSILFNLVLYFYFLLTPIYSVSAPPFPFEVEQPDGSKIPVHMFGHEYYNWMETEDGYVIDWVESDNRLGWYYCDLNSVGKFSPTHILVEYPAPNNLHISRKLKESKPYVRKIAHDNRYSGNPYDASVQRSAETSIIKPLVFLVDFDDLPSGMPDREYSKEKFQQLLFENDLESDGSILPSDYDMSVRDYFYEISNGKLEVFGNEESLVDWTKVSQSYTYYTDEAQGTGHGPNGLSRGAGAIVVELATLLNSNTNIDFSNFDGNQDGSVDVIVLIVEGWGISTRDDHFWPHMSVIHSSTIPEDVDLDNDGFLEFDGVSILKYIVIPEQYLYSPNEAPPGLIHPIGTICHELGHVLGLPDLYDTSLPKESSAAGIGKWGLMGSGNWQRQTSPAYMNAWSRYQLGFINPVIIDAAINNEEILFPAESGEEGLLAMILPMNSNMPQEYLILENRQKLGSDQHLKNSGLLVWHIDETITSMYPAINSVNVNPDFYGVKLLQADGKAELEIEKSDNDSDNADTGDPFPGSMGVTELEGLSNPNTDTYSYDRDGDGNVEEGGASSISISNIDETSDGLITFTLTNPNIQGSIKYYDEGSWYYLYPDSDKDYEWVGIKFSNSATSLLSGILTVIRPDTRIMPYEIDVDNYVTSYDLRIWKGWDSIDPSYGIPIDLEYESYDNILQWSVADDRNGGWIFISLLDHNIIIEKDVDYYVEINYTGSEYIIPFDYALFSASPVSGESFNRKKSDTACSSFQLGDWNIRVVLSGIDDFTNLSTNIPSMPRKHEIYSNYPNPFNPVTTLSIYLQNPSPVDYTVLDVRGRKIMHEEFNLLVSGMHDFKVNMKQFSSGVYFYQFTINDEKYSPYKMLLLK